MMDIFYRIKQNAKDIIKFLLAVLMKETKKHHAVAVGAKQLLYYLPRIEAILRRIYYNKFPPQIGVEQLPMTAHAKCVYEKLRHSVGQGGA